MKDVATVKESKTRNVSVESFISSHTKIMEDTNLSAPEQAELITELLIASELHETIRRATYLGVHKTITDYHRKARNGPPLESVKEVDAPPIYMENDEDISARARQKAKRRKGFLNSMRRYEVRETSIMDRRLCGKPIGDQTMQDLTDNISIMSKSISTMNKTHNFAENVLRVALRKDAGLNAKVRDILKEKQVQDIWDKHHDK